jgi:hypothetical protein
MDDFLSHARRPKSGEVIGDSRDRLVMLLGRAKFPI